MSFFKKVFGQKAKKGPTLTEALKRLKESEEILVKKQSCLESKIQNETATAKKNASSNKKVALQALQRKKRFERQLRHVDGALTTVEAQKEVLENANINKLAVSSLEDTLKALKTTHKNIDVNGIEAILNDTVEEKGLVNDIADAIAEPVGFKDDDFDEAELEKELEDLTAGVTEIAVETTLPSVPKDDLRDPEKGTKKTTIVATS